MRGTNSRENVGKVQVKRPLYLWGRAFLLGSHFRRAFSPYILTRDKTNPLRQISLKSGHVPVLLAFLPNQLAKMPDDNQKKARALGIFARRAKFLRAKMHGMCNRT